MICEQTTNEVGRFPEIETVFSTDGSSAGKVAVSRYGGLVVTAPGRYERLGQTEVFDLPLVAME